MNPSVRSNNLNEVMKNYGANSIYDEVVSVCTYATLKAMVDDFVHLVKTFHDGKNEEHIEKYKSKLTTSDKARILILLRSVNVATKPVVTDVMTSKTTEHVGIAVGQNSFTFQKKTGPDVEKKCDMGFVGGRSSSLVLATIGSVCNTEVQQKKDKNFKNIAYDKTNEYAPNEILSVTLGSIGITCTPTAHQIEQAAVGIKDATQETFEKIIDVVNPAMPLVKVNDTVQTIGKFGLQGMSRYYVPLKNQNIRRNIWANFAVMQGGVAKYAAGIKKPAVKRIARNGYCGVPVDGLPMDHIVSCLEAGVKYGDSLLYVGADSGVLSLLRSNFGTKVKGVGNGEHLIAAHKCKVSVFDWVYYPSPITLATAKTFTESVKATLDKLIDMVSVSAIGKKIMHVTPLLYYCREFASVMGQHTDGEFIANNKTVMERIDDEPSQRLGEFVYDGTLGMWSPLEIPKDWRTRLHPPTIVEKVVMSVNGQNIEKEISTYPKWVHNDYGTDTWKRYTIFERLKLNDTGDHTPLTGIGLDELFYDTFGSFAIDLTTINTYTELSYNQMRRFLLPVRASMFSYRGTMMHVDGVVGVSIANACGHMIHYMKGTFKNIWNMSNLSPHTYCINFMRKGAIVNELEFRDEFSACYDTAVLDELTVKSEKAYVQVTEAIKEVTTTSSVSIDNVYEDIQGDVDKF